MIYKNQNVLNKKIYVVSGKRESKHFLRRCLSSNTNKNFQLKQKQK